MSRPYVTKQERRAQNYTTPIAEPVHIAGKPRVMRLKIDLIKMADYQRKPSDRVIKRIIDEYDPDRDRPVELSYRDGAYWCFDGQHRTQAHKLMRNDTILAQVHFGLSYEQEAALFAKQHQNERAVGIKDLWEAGVKAGDMYPEIQKIIHICNEAGFEISTRPKNKKNTIECIQAIQTLYDRFGEQGLKDVLFVIQTAWKDYPHNTHREIFTGFIKLMDAYEFGDKEWNRLRDRLAKITPEQFLMKANSHTGRGGKRTALLMVHMFNMFLGDNSPMRLDEYKIR